MITSFHLQHHGTMRLTLRYLLTIASVETIGVFGFTLSRKRTMHRQTAHNTFIDHLAV